MTAAETEQAKALASAIAAATVATVVRQLKAGMDQQVVWEACRDHLHETFHFPLRAAANMTRMIFQTAAKRMGLEGPFTMDEVDTLHTLVSSELAG